MQQNGGCLDLSGTGITSLPENLTVGSCLVLSGTGITNIKKVKRLVNGDYVPSRYLYCDNVLTHIKSKKTLNNFTFYVGKIKGKNVISDGKNYAHCSSFRDGVSDLAYKSCAERGAEQYRSIDKNLEIPLCDCMTMYRVITGACKQGTESFANSIVNPKSGYTVMEMVDVTKGQYGHDTFTRFFEV